MVNCSLTRWRKPSRIAGQHFRFVIPHNVVDECLLEHSRDALSPAFTCGGALPDRSPHRRQTGQRLRQSREPDSF